MIIIVSPSKEMTDQPPAADRPPRLLELAEAINCGNELKEDISLYRAINLYNGLQFRYLREGLGEEELDFLDGRLRILSAAYGLVKPFDGIRHYRQDFKTKGLYKAWSNQIYQALTEESRVILNLASDEFSKTITRYATVQDQIISVDFYEADGILKKHASISKKGRGQMVNYIARNRITDIRLVKAFDDKGYRFSEQHSEESNWVFIRQKD